MKNIETDIHNRNYEKGRAVSLDALMQSMRRLSAADMIPADILLDPCRTVNPELVDFLDGDGKPGYAVSYEEVEHNEPGTVIEMEWEKKHLAELVGSVIDRGNSHSGSGCINMIEIGTAPALGSLEGLWSPLLSRTEALVHRKVRIVTADISWAMSGLGALTLRETRLEERLHDYGVPVELYAAHADGFHLIENIRDGDVSVISAPFGILGYGLGHRTIDETVALCSGKLETGGIVSMNGYTAGWGEYTRRLKEIIRSAVPESSADAVYREIVPFVIDIYEEEGTGRSMMSVGNGEGFPCATHNPEEVAAVYEHHGLTVVDIYVTPTGYCIIPKAILGMYKNGKIPELSELRMLAGEYIGRLLADAQGGIGAARQIAALQDEALSAGIAPYYTVSGRKN